MTLEGRWTVFLEGAYAVAVTESPSLYTPRDHAAVPVVPCDDAAVERAARALWEDAIGKAIRDDYPWDSTVDHAVDLRERYLRYARVVLSAAGEKP